MHATLDQGITTFDTADSYASGRAEELFGVELKGQPRDGIDILTKVYWPTGPGPNERGLSRKNIVNAVESSLRRLVTSRVSMVDESR